MAAYRIDRDDAGVRLVGQRVVPEASSGVFTETLTPAEARDVEARGSIATPLARGGGPSSRGRPTPAARRGFE